MDNGKKYSIAKYLFYAVYVCAFWNNKKNHGSFRLNNDKDKFSPPRSHSTFIKLGRDVKNGVNKHRLLMCWSYTEIKVPECNVQRWAFFVFSCAYEDCLADERVLFFRCLAVVGTICQELLSICDNKQ